MSQPAAQIAPSSCHYKQKRLPNEVRTSSRGLGPDGDTPPRLLVTGSVEPM
jgi:hypothetical protein